MTPGLRTVVLTRDEFRCQRCDGAGAEVHHRVTRSRGGRLADDHLGSLLEFGLLPRIVGWRAAHLATLCQPCHATVHGEWEEPWMVRGSFLTQPDGMVVYVGPDVELADLWNPNRTADTTPPDPAGDLDRRLQTAVQALVAERMAELEDRT